MCIYIYICAILVGWYPLPQLCRSKVMVPLDIWQGTLAPPKELIIFFIGQKSQRRAVILQHQSKNCTLQIPTASTQQQPYHLQVHA